MAEQVNLLELIRQQTPRAVKAVQNAGAVAVDNSMKAEAVAAGVEQSYRQAAEDQALVVRTAQIGNLQAQEASRKALDAAGGFDAILATISSLRAEQVRLQPELENLRNENIAASGFSPIEWIKQAFDVNGTQAKINSSVTAIQTLSSVGQQLEQRIGAAGQIAKNTAETMTVASVEAATRAAQTEWQVRAAQARLEGLKYNTQSMEAIAQAEDRTLEVLTRAANFERGEQQFQLSLREEERRASSARIQEDLMREARADKLDAKAIDDSIVYKINLGRAARGDAPIGGLEAKQMIQMFKGNNPEMLDLYKKGEFVAKTGVSLIGYSPADTAKVIASNPQILQQLPPERQKAMALVVEAQQALAVARGTNPMLQDDKDGAKAASFINNSVNKQVAGYISDVGNNLDNPFHLGDLSSYIGTAARPGVSSFQNLPLVQKVLNPAIAGNMSLSDPNTVVGLAQAAVRKGELTSSQAAEDISNIYRRANLLHRRAVGFETLGIAMPKDGQGYMARINGKLVDVTDFRAVAWAMNAAEAQRVYGESFVTPSNIYGRGVPRP